MTSAECLALLEEKEEKKRKRRITRELNKKKREEEQKRKAEERAKKAAEKQAENKKKEAEKVAKLAAKNIKQQKRQLNKLLKSQDKVVLALIARGLFHEILHETALDKRHQSCHHLTPIRVVLALDLTRTMWALAVNGYSYNAVVSWTRPLPSPRW